jgi:hypothetical protein
MMERVEGIEPIASEERPACQGWRTRKKFGGPLVSGARNW